MCVILKHKLSITCTSSLLNVFGEKLGNKKLRNMSNKKSRLGLVASIFVVEKGEKVFVLKFLNLECVFILNIEFDLYDGLSSGFSDISSRRQFSFKCADKV